MTLSAGHHDEWHCDRVPPVVGTDVAHADHVWGIETEMSEAPECLMPRATA